MRRSVRIGAIAALTWSATAVLLDANQIVIGPAGTYGGRPTRFTGEPTRFARRSGRA
jgi:hypothetical protein